MLWMRWRNGSGQKQEISGSIRTPSEREHADKGGDREAPRERSGMTSGCSPPRMPMSIRRPRRRGAAQVEKIKEHIDQNFPRMMKLEAVRKASNTSQLTAAHAATTCRHSAARRADHSSPGQNTNVQRLHARIDDAVRLSLPQTMTLPVPNPPSARRYGSHPAAKRAASPGRAACAHPLKAVFEAELQGMGSWPRAHQGQRSRSR